MIDEKLKIKFRDRKLINRALTHPSKSKDNYQRLEFLGDSILDFIVGEYLFKNSNFDEGKLTVLRAHYVSEENLAECFNKLNIEDELILGKSLQNKVSKAIKADVMEAVIAVIYLENGLDFVRDFLVNVLELDGFKNVENTNYKSQLQELVQANFKCTMQYVTVKEGDIFTSQFYMDEDLVATGYGNDKLSAEQNCAYVAINKLFSD